ncbi:uncharacterized protein LOC113560617 [Rhopalosiphum maidis]|uniref:uncharacterized protein LOC113560617 n=1 Tax=Rhopalosiphum maidis TaxID=43146 RepID=UPI000EFFD9B3|nr:uncharacterized protein LOC113560617 [Rhopalosiphum maidis]
MDILDEDNHVLNIRLAKRIGLYQILDPETVKCRGQNVYHVVVALVVLYLCAVSMMLNASGVYYWTDNVAIISVDYFWKAQTGLFVFYKMWIAVYRSNDVWNCLSVTRYGFTSFSVRDGHVLYRWRERSVWFTNTLTVMYLTSLAFFLCSSLAFRKDVLPVKNHDGSVGYYRQNILNLYLIVSDETYNTHYYKFYFVESLSVVLLTILFLVFDVLLVTLCFALCCQMQMICSAFESVGHKSPSGSNSSVDRMDEKKKISIDYDLIYYDELKTIIMDHQAVMKKFEELLTLFQRVMLSQFVISSMSLIIIWFFFILKDSVIFALYSSNWTEMNMKCKKLILLTMQMNNVYYKKFRFTKNKVVNLDMFLKTLRNCYTVVSVLINCTSTQSQNN